MVRRRRTSLRLRFGANRIGGVANDLISRLEITEDLYIAVHTQARDHIHPFRFPSAYALDERTLLVIGHGGNRYKHSWSGTIDRPLHTTKTPRTQTPIGAIDVPLHGH